MGAFDCDSVFIFWNPDFRFSNITLRGWEICPQSFSWINRTPDITGFPLLLYLKKVTTNFKSCKHCLLLNLSISHFTSWYDMVWREKPGSMHERGRSICYHSRDYGPNWTPLGPITITNSRWTHIAKWTIGISKRKISYFESDTEYHHFQLCWSVRS